MVTVQFKITPREDVDQAEYERTFSRMLELVSQMPGFLGIDGYAGEDGTELAVARFESDEAVKAWKQHPEHLETQERGRRNFFAAHDITVAEVLRHYEWSAAAAAATA
jgi:heme-degrading monooxygenase HmoA